MCALEEEVNLHIVYISEIVYKFEMDSKERGPKDFSVFYNDYKYFFYCYASFWQRLELRIELSVRGFPSNGSKTVLDGRLSAIWPAGIASAQKLKLQLGEAL